jgi:FixJ family two-component response regulator
VPIIFASSVSDTAFVRRIKQDGSGDFLPKPFTLEAFLASVHKALERPQGDTGFVW